MFPVLVASGVVFLIFSIVNFVLAGYMVKIDVFPAVLVYFMSRFYGQRGFFLSVITAVFLGLSYGKLSFYIIFTVAFSFLLYRAKEHFILDNPNFILFFTLLFLSLKTLFYLAYVRKVAVISSTIMLEYLFNIIINAVVSYPVFVLLNKLCRGMKEIYEKSLHYA